MHSLQELLGESLNNLPGGRKFKRQIKANEPNCGIKSRQHLLTPKCTNAHNEESDSHTGSLHSTSAESCRATRCPFPGRFLVRRSFRVPSKKSLVRWRYSMNESTDNWHGCRVIRVYARNTARFPQLIALGQPRAGRYGRIGLSSDLGGPRCLCIPG